MSTDLHTVIARGDAASVLQRLNDGADVNLRNQNGDLPIHVAARYGRLQAAQVVLGQGDNHLVTLNQYGWTPIQYAAVWGQQAMVEWLVMKGASLSHTDVWGMTALHHAAACGHHQTVEYLAQHPDMDITAVNHRGETAADVAETAGHNETSAWLRQLNITQPDTPAATTAVQDHGLFLLLSLYKLLRGNCTETIFKIVVTKFKCCRYFEIEDTKSHSDRDLYDFLNAINIIGRNISKTQANFRVNQEKGSWFIYNLQDNEKILQTIMVHNMLEGDEKNCQPLRNLDLNFLLNIVTNTILQYPLSESAKRYINKVKDIRIGLYHAKYNFSKEAFNRNLEMLQEALQEIYRVFGIPKNDLDMKIEDCKRETTDPVASTTDPIASLNLHSSDHGLFLLVPLYKLLRGNCTETIFKIVVTKFHECNFFSKYEDAHTHVDKDFYGFLKAIRMKGTNRFKKIKGKSTAEEKQSWIIYNLEDNEEILQTVTVKNMLAADEETCQPLKNLDLNFLLNIVTNAVLQYPLSESAKESINQVKDIRNRLYHAKYNFSIEDFNRNLEMLQEVLQDIYKGFGIPLHDLNMQIKKCKRDTTDAVLDMQIDECKRETTDSGCDPPCVNGKCDKKGVCKCDKGWDGPTCEGTMCSMPSTDCRFITFSQRLKTLSYQHAVAQCGQKLLHLIMRILICGDINNISKCVKEKLGSNTRFKKSFTKDEQQCLETEDHINWDITLLVKVIQKVCDLAPEYSECWTHHTGAGDDDDETLEYLITTLKNLRITMLHEFNSIITEDELEESLNDLTDLSVKMTSALGKHAQTQGKQLSEKEVNETMEVIFKIIDGAKTKINESAPALSSQSG